jgi:hypothetical protein
MKPEKQNKRSYAPFYEKLIPIILVLLAILVVAVIVVIFFVALGYTTGNG